MRFEGAFHHQTSRTYLHKIAFPIVSLLSHEVDHLVYLIHPLPLYHNTVPSFIQIIISCFHQSSTSSSDSPKSHFPVARSNNIFPQIRDHLFASGITSFSRTPKTTIPYLQLLPPRNLSGQALRLYHPGNLCNLQHTTRIRHSRVTLMHQHPHPHSQHHTSFHHCPHCPHQTTQTQK